MSLKLAAFGSAPFSPRGKIAEAPSRDKQPLHLGET